MKEFFKQTDMLFRFGSKEFVMIIEPVPKDSVHKILDNFRQAIADHKFPQISQITISLSYAMIRENDFPPDILNLADKALYYTKEHGKDYVYNYVVISF